jgi:epoxyqueuosine reductase
MMLPHLEQLAAFAAAEAGGEVSDRAYVDTGPVLERAYAARAGLGFIGKNTCLIHPRMGSWLFLGVVLVSVELAPTSEQVRGGCGTCRRCLEACPTGALVEPYVLDARRCISYLTIELKGPIPHQLRPLLVNRIYGCDVCQAVCPWQKFAQATRQPAFLAEAMDRGAPALLDLIEIGEEDFRERYGSGPLLRTGRERLLRNVAVALGNWGDERAATALVRALADGDPLVRGHAAWALGRIGGRAARAVLEDALRDERDPYVRSEVEVAIGML